MNNHRLAKLYEVSKLPFPLVRKSEFDYWFFRALATTDKPVSKSDEFKLFFSIQKKLGNDNE